MAAALALHLELEVEETGEFSVETDLPVAARAREPVRARVRAAAPARTASRFRIRSEIPLSGGLGSSAAAIVAGLMAADHMFELDADLLALATELEGHPDNVAAALQRRLRGLRRRARRAASSRRPASRRSRWCPHEAVRTHAARAALPAQVPLEDAVFNVAHGALLTLGLARGDWDLVGRGLHDRLHQQPARAPVPALVRAGRRAHASWARSARRSRAPARRCSCGASTSRPAPSPRRSPARSEGWATLLRAPFEPQGAYVGDL